jgi:hypothetical protein
MTTPRPKTFIRVVEFWVPGTDRTLLEYGGGLYGAAPSFGALSRSMVFGRGEGLPGAAWEAGHPLVLKDLQGPGFLRPQVARAAGLTCGIAVPIFAGDFLTSVMVLFCGDDDAHAGAIELWHNDPAESKDMTLVDGYYGTTGDAFELISRSASFRQGIGLPGMAWESGLPVFLPDLGRSGRFLRADSALQVGINRGFAIPCAARAPGRFVMTFLSALATPIARRFEVWQPDGARGQLVRTDGFCEHDGLLAPDRAAPAPRVDALLDHGDGAIGRAALTGVPAVTESAGQEPGPGGAAAARAGLGALAAWPVLRDGRLAAVVAWYF